MGVSVYHTINTTPFLVNNYKLLPTPLFIIIICFYLFKHNTTNTNTNTNITNTNTTNTNTTNTNTINTVITVNRYN